MRDIADAEHLQGWCAPWDEAEFFDALTGGGDSRLAVDPSRGTNRYFVPPRPIEAGVCFSSCTASPISPAGFRAALRCFIELVSRRSEDDAASRRGEWERRTAFRLASYLGVVGHADVVLLPSGTDGILLCSILLSLEAGGERLTPILPEPSETGAGVPHAALRRAFDRPQICGGLAGAVAIRLRDPDGSLRDQGEVSDDYRFAARAAAGRPVIYQTLGTKTGLVAPVYVPSATEVVVDASQMRVSSRVLQDSLKEGRPVVVTGSKYLGGPPFSGAVLLPTGRFSEHKEAAITEWRRVTGAPLPGTRAALGPLLRWVAAIADMERASRASVGFRCVSLPWRTMVHQALSRIPEVEMMPGPSVEMSDAVSVLPSIFSFAIRDPERPDEYLSAAQLRPVHEALVRRGILLGQPVEVGAHGALRAGVRSER